MIKNKIKLIFFFFLCLNLNNKNKVIIDTENKNNKKNEVIKFFENNLKLKAENINKLNEFLNLYNLRIDKEYFNKKFKIILSKKNNEEIDFLDKNVIFFIDLIENNINEDKFKSLHVYLKSFSKEENKFENNIRFIFCRS